MNSAKNYTKYTDLDLSEDIKDIKDNNKVALKEVKVVFGKEHSEDVLNDYKYIREKLVNLIANSETVMEKSLDVIKDETTPRNVEAFTSLIKVISETTDRLTTLHEKQHKIVRDIKKELNKSETPDDNEKPNKLRTNLNAILSELENEK